MLTLALGMGSTIASYGFVDALMWRTLPVTRPETLVAVSAIDPAGQPASFTLDLVAHVSREAASFERVAAYLGGGTVTVDVGGALSRTSVAAVSADYFTVLDLRPSVGRWFNRSGLRQLAPDAAEELVLGHDFWMRQFGANPAVVGTMVHVEGIPFRVVGITPRAFQGLEVGLPTDITIPIDTVARVLKLPPLWPIPVTHILGRVKTSATMDSVRAELTTRWPQLLLAGVPSTFSQKQREHFLAIRPLTTAASRGFSRIRDSYSRTLMVLLAFSALMLAVACANVAALLLASAKDREHEFSIRLALGASRSALLREIMTEALLLSALGATLAIPVAWWSHTIITATIEPLASVSADIEWDAGMVLLVVVLVLASALAVSCLPAWILSKRNPGAVLQQRPHTVLPTTARWSQRVLTLQLAAAVVVLSANLSFVRIVFTLQTNDAGFRSEGLLLAGLVPQPGGYDQMNDGVYYRQLLDQLSRIPMVSAVALSKSPPISGRDSSLTQPVSAARLPDVAILHASLEVVSPYFFSTLGIPILSGRDLEWTDNLASPPVTIVSARLAQLLFPKGDAIGQYIRFGVEPRHQNLRIIGIAQDASLGALHVRQPLVVFVAWLQQPPPYARWPTVEIRTAGDPRLVAAEIRRATASLGREYVESLRTLEQQIDRSLARERLVASIATLCGTLTTVLVSVGLTAFLRHALAQQRREIGIRLALGAQSGSVRRLIFERGVAIAAVGASIGVGAAFAVMLFVRRIFPGVSVDIGAILAAAGSLLVLSFCIGVGPAHRAARIAPMEALRCD